MKLHRKPQAKPLPPPPDHRPPHIIVLAGEYRAAIGHLRDHPEIDFRRAVIVTSNQDTRRLMGLRLEPWQGDRILMCKTYYALRYSKREGIFDTLNIINRHGVEIEDLC